MCIVPETCGFRRKAQGAMAEYTKFPGNAINHRIPGQVPIDHAVYVEPLACAIHAVAEVLRLTDACGCDKFIEASGTGVYAGVDDARERIRTSSRTVESDVDLQPVYRDRYNRVYLRLYETLRDINHVIGNGAEPKNLD